MTSPTSTTSPPGPIDAPAGRAGRLERRVDDGAQERRHVVRRPERLAEAERDVAAAAALVLEIPQPRLQLGGHVVERVPELGELVRPLDRHALG